MTLKIVFVIQINQLPISKEYEYYPTTEEIEQEIKYRFPNGYIYDSFSNENIYPRAQVKKIYKLDQKEENK
ncbi:hypothetical protein [Evansella tamaricis]|uniref:Uncharacterized protein n=1 Tax=Evansella tamaricis TaxID=2069301 RepID=A0ABS6JBP9_9BACI|nr:hypothetical protein [Evansella tamaricis]MBU9711103.1 hypothetical protein [Evansella tamaricis]